MIIDAHQHFWHYHPESHSWIDDSMQVIRKDFLPDELAVILNANGIDGCIAVQADQSKNETDFLIGLSQKYNFIKAVIGWVDLKAEDLEEQLTYLKQFSILKGFRHILQAEEPDFMLSKEFLKGIKLLQEYGYCYEILIYPKHLPASIKLVNQFPDMRFVIDHIAKPNIKEKQISEWQKGIESFGKHKNVFCKLSGMVTEADWENWSPSDFEPYLTIVKETFGFKRLMYGSDWPVCLLAADYKIQLELCHRFLGNCLDQEFEMVMGGNAMQFYKI